MTDKRQKNQLQLAFMSEERGEASEVCQQGNEPATAKREPESPTSATLMEEVLEKGNLKQALKRVKANKGGPGIDHVTVAQLPEYLKEHWPSIRQQLLSGTYKPQPVRRVEIPKPDGGVRKLGIPTTLDRFLQQALLQILQQQWDGTFSAHSYGFRPGRSAHQAVAQAQQYIAAGYNVVVDIDLEKFFDRVNHDILMDRIARRVEDKRVLKLIRAYLNAGVMEHGTVSPTDEGTPQGGPLSPLLSNLLLDELDKELEKRGHRFCRFADDCNIYVKSERAGKRVMESISEFITGKLKLKINTQKSAVGTPKDRKFLGFNFINTSSGIKRAIAPKPRERLKERIRELTGRNKGKSLAQIIKKLASYLYGWKGYFGFCQTPQVLKDLDKWIRRRVRCLIWKMWKNYETRLAELRKRGVRGLMATTTASSSKGAWHISQTRSLKTAFSNTYFRALGLPQLAA